MRFMSVIETPEIILRKNMTVTAKLTFSFGAVLLLTAALSFTSIETARRLGGLLHIQVNEGARTADLIGAVGVDLHRLKELSIQTQFAYAVSNVLDIAPKQRALENDP